MYGNRLYVITSALNASVTGIEGLDVSTGVSKKVWDDSLQEQLKLNTLRFAKTILFQVTANELDEVSRNNRVEE